MKSQKKKWGFVVLLISLFGLMLLLNVLTPWIADDYRYAYSFATEEKLQTVWDIFPSLKAHRYIMNGRSTPHFLLHLFTLLPECVFDIANSLVFVLLILGMHRLVCGSGQYDIFMFCALTGAVFLFVPGFGSSFLWMAGSCNYLWCDTLLIWLLIPFVDNLLSRAPAPSKYIQFLMPPVALFFGNMSQNVSAAGIMLMGLCIMWLFFTHKTVCWWMVFTFVSAFAGWFLCMRAPTDIGLLQTGTLSAGVILNNFHRAAGFLMDHGVGLCAALLVLICFSWFEKQDKTHIYLAAIMFLAALAANYAMMVSVYYPSRAFTGSVILLICGCGLVLPKQLHKAIRPALALVLIFVMGVTMLHALPSIYECYAMSQDREAQVQAAVASNTMDYSTFGIVSRSRYDGFFEIYDLTVYNDHTANTYYARYHGLNSITATRFE